MFFCCCVVHGEIGERGGELHQRAGEEDPHNHRPTCSTAGMSGMFHVTGQPLKYTLYRLYVCEKCFEFDVLLLDNYQCLMNVIFQGKIVKLSEIRQ